MIRKVLFTFFLLSLTSPALAGGGIAGPVEALVTRIIDGDTIAVRAQVWPGLVAETLVRLEGIDTPELPGACETEHALAAKAKALLIQVAGGAVRLEDIEPGKYAGRVIARVRLDDGSDVSALLLEAGLARPYRGGKRKGWCK
jgi:endonuclease YncB( thermonuclease family)